MAQRAILFPSQQCSWHSTVINLGAEAMNSLSTSFLVLSHERDGPLRYRLVTRFETIPPCPISQGR
jgi:hypothetical protein